MKEMAQTATQVGESDRLFFSGATRAFWTCGDRRIAAASIAVLLALVIAAGCGASSSVAVDAEESAAGSAGAVWSLGAGGNADAVGSLSGAGSAGAVGSAGVAGSTVAAGIGGAAGSAGAAGGTEPACYSPVEVDLEPTAPGIKGCECETYQADKVGLGRLYCLSGRAVYCPREVGHWIVGFDGPCFPKQSATELEICTRELGGAPVASGTECPSGFAAEGGFQGPANTLVDCCYPIRVSAQNCTQAGLEAQDGENTDDVLQTTCSNGNALRGFVGESGTTVCCEPD